MKIDHRIIFRTWVRLTLSSAFILALATASAQPERRLARDGNKAYKKQSFEQAELSYRKALVENPVYPEGRFNLGDALYKQERYEESVKPFEQILAETESEEMKAWTYHNMGNAQLEAKKYQEAIASYKSALRIRPHDMDTKYNLAYAQQLLKEQQQNGEGENQDQNEDEQQDDQQEQNQDQEKQDQENNQDQQEDQNQDGDKQKETDQKEGDKDQQGNQEKKQQRPNQLSKEDAERILQALQAEEQKVQAKVQKEKGKATTIVTDKDW